MGGVKTERRRISAVALLDTKPILVTEAGLPKTIPLFRFGKNPSTKGDFIVDETTLAAVRSQIDNPAFRRVVIDFEHQSCKSSPNFKPAPRHHAAYGDVALTADNSIVLENVVYTPTGNEFAPDFHDVSPVPIHTADGVILGIQSVGLVPQGSLLESSLFSADFDPAPMQTPLAADSEIIVALQTALADMNKTIEALKGENAALRQMIDDQAQKLAALPATALDAGALDPVKVQAAGAAAAVAEHKTLLDAQRAEISAHKTTLDTQAATIAKQTQQITALSTALDAQRKETMLQLAAAAGKAVALAETAVAAMSVEDLAAHIRALGSAVPLVRKTPGNSGERAATTLAAQQNELIAQIRAQTGITDFQVLWNTAREQKPALFQ